MSALTSQPCLNAIVEALRFTRRETGLDREALDRLSEYWEHVRALYAPFETGMKAPSADVYLHEMPGGQYTNLYQQAQSMGLAGRWHEVCRMYAEVNRMFGDIVKVTPSSKVVGDMALFMVSNHLTADDVLCGDRALAFPESVVEFFEGRLGRPPGGFPKKLQQRVLGQRAAIRGRPGAGMPPADFEATAAALERKLGSKPSRRDVLSYLLYPRVFLEFAEHQHEYADTSIIPTDVFFYGVQPNEEVSFDIEPGKTLIVKLLSVGDPHPDGRRTVFFELNGQPRDVQVFDRSLAAEKGVRPQADPGNPSHVAAPMPGLVVNVAVQPGDLVKKGQKLVGIEAMKMEMTVYAPHDGRIERVHAEAGRQVDAGELLLEIQAGAS